MFTTLSSIALFIALIRTVFAQSGFSIDTPTMVQCQATQITWTDATSPYDLFVVSAQDMCGDALENLGNQNSTAATWTVDLPAGTQVVLFIEDMTGNEAWSGTVTVANSNDTSCLPDTSSSASSPAVSGTALTVPPDGAAAPTAHSSPTPFAPAGAANAGLGSASGALSTRPLSAATLFSSAGLVVAVFAL